ncbi:MAG TPA: DUF2569 family protein [Dongiaceae bacterium]|nr:DUF2569 family protein [Dongiaceae bacterium]
MAQDADNDRPGLGFWLGFLTFGLCMAPIRTALGTYGEISAAEQATPAILELPSWLVYKYIAAGLCISVLIAAIVAIHAIHAGRTRRHLLRIVALLWYISIGTFVLDFLVAGVLFEFENAMLVFEDSGTTIQLLLGAVFTGLWTAYLLLSDRCRDRYPRTGPDGRIVQAFD